MARGEVRHPFKDASGSHLTLAAQLKAAVMTLRTATAAPSRRDFNIEPIISGGEGCAGGSAATGAGTRPLIGR